MCPMGISNLVAGCLPFQSHTFLLFLYINIYMYSLSLSIYILYIYSMYIRL